MDEQDATEQRIREKAHRLWEAEGRPHGRAEWHWDQAKEMVAIEDSYQNALEPIPEGSGEPVEPALAAENLGDLPDLADQGEQVPAPSREVAADHAADLGDSPPAPTERPSAGRRSAAAERPKSVEKPAKRAARPAENRSAKVKSDARGQFAPSQAARDNDGLSSAVPVVLTGDGDATRAPDPADPSRRSRT